MFVLGGHDGSKYSSDVVLLNLGKTLMFEITSNSFVFDAFTNISCIRSDNELGNQKDLWNPPTTTWISYSRSV